MSGQPKSHAGVRPNLLAIFHGKYRSEDTLDYVTLGRRSPGRIEALGADPFKPHVKSGFLFGRGVEDNGQAIAASIFAAKAVKETLGFGINVGLTIFPMKSQRAIMALISL